VVNRRSGCRQPQRRTKTGGDCSNVCSPLEALFAERDVDVSFAAFSGESGEERGRYCVGAGGAVVDGVGIGGVADEHVGGDVASGSSARTVGDGDGEEEGGGRFVSVGGDVARQRGRGGWGA